LLTLLVIPLGCVSLGESVFVSAASKGPNAGDEYDQRMIDQRMSETDRRADGRRSSD